MTSKRLGVRAGEAYRYIAGHQRRKRNTPEAATPFKIDGIECRVIRLPDGYVTIVDAADYAWLAPYSWHLKHDRTGRTYVVRKGLLEDDQTHCQIPMHRQILRLSPGDAREGDHINSDTLNNSRRNLRIADEKGTARNARTRLDNTSGFKGVQRHGSGWRFRVHTDSGRYHSRVYATPEEAFRARCAMLPAVHEEFARAK